MLKLIGTVVILGNVVLALVCVATGNWLMGGLFAAAAVLNTAFYLD